jgi:hypothetical protein
MNRTENQLREALDEAARTVQQGELRPLVARQARSRIRRRALIAATASGLVTAAVGMLFWPTSSHSVAWSATPQEADPNVTAQLVEHCLSVPEIPAADRADRPVIVDLRGNSAVVIVDLRGNRKAARSQDGPYAATCSFVGLDLADPDNLTYVAANTGLHDEPIRAVGDSVFTVESLSSSAVDADALSQISGQVEPTVDRVVVTLDDRTRVRATVQDGWYLAWWPEQTTWWTPWNGGAEQRLPTLVRAYDANGKLLKELVPEGVPDR